jgi:HPt (histidine-containing phosphotransfer) domain-containing protein
MYDKELGKEIIDTFMEEYESDYKKVEDAYASKDYEAIHKAIHYMKGTFTYLAAERLKRFTQKVLQLSTDKQYEEVLKFESLYFTYLAQLKSELEKYN